MRLYIQSMLQKLFNLYTSLKKNLQHTKTCKHCFLMSKQGINTLCQHQCNNILFLATMSRLYLVFKKTYLDLPKHRCTHLNREQKSKPLTDKIKLLKTFFKNKLFIVNLNTQTINITHALTLKDIIKILYQNFIAHVNNFAIN